MVGQLIGSLLFGYFGIAVAASGVSRIVNRKAVQAVLPEFIRPSLGRGIVASLTAGFSTLLAAALVWSQWQIALVLGLWPPLLFGFLLLSKRITVISSMSSGDAARN